MTLIICDSCIYWMPQKNIPEYGECRKNAPSAIIKSNSGQIVPANHAAIWPFTRSIDGCFEGKKGSAAGQPINPNDTPELAQTSPNSVYNKAGQSTKKTTSDFNKAVSKAKNKLNK